MIVDYSQTLRSDGNVHRRRNAMRSQGADQRQEAIAIILLVRPQSVVFLTLDPEDVCHAITATLQLARGVDHDSVEIAALRPTGDRRAANGRGSQYDRVARS